MTPHTGSGEVVHPVTPEELREAARRIEARAEVDVIRQGSFVGYHFDQAGRCWEHWLVTVPCPRHEQPWTDEYNYGYNYCTHCNTAKGTMRVLRRVSAPQYDAPQPPADYTP